MIGCSEKGEDRPSHEPPNGTTSDTLRPEQFFGRYVAVNVIPLEGLTDNREADMQAIRGSVAIIQADKFVTTGSPITQPKYAIKRYPLLPEGEVPFGIYRRMSYFFGYGEKRFEITGLEVHEAGKPYTCFIEIIDSDTLWEADTGVFLVQWKRID